jgi:hypothetical protein
MGYRSPKVIGSTNRRMIGMLLQNGAGANKKFDFLLRIDLTQRQ